MAKQAGLGARLLVGGFDISGDIQALDTVSGGPAPGDVTDITQSAHSRLGLLRDGKLGFTSYMDVANAHPVLDSLPRADTLMTFMVPVLAAGAPAACLNAKQVNYDPTRSNAGDLTLKVDGEGNSFGLEWGLALTAGIRTDTAATTGPAIDTGLGGDTSFGLQAYLQVTQFTGTDVTVTLSHSTTSGGTYASISPAFAQITAAPQSQRIFTSRTALIHEFLKVSTTTTGGFSLLSFAVVLCRNPVAVTF